MRKSAYNNGRPYKTQPMTMGTQILPRCLTVLLFGACWGVAVAGCIVEAPEGKMPRRTAPPPATSTAPLTVKLGANLDDKVEVTVAQVTPGQLQPGGQARVGMLLKVHQPLGKDYKVFVHAEGEGRNERLLFDHDPVRGRGSSTWTKGEQLQDDFVISLPSTFLGNVLNVWVGFWDPLTDERLPLKNTEAVRNDGSNRIFLARIPVVSAP